ncbi:hypothetical protein [Flavobacterium yafengii]|uniref:hypothetical protein n=1 Tax=Flavobacterium yafengii TaxID=3041253 RepID=UPI0024A85DC2|nr:hypothetical protein [Flavobacterium yafengii]MDI6047144.1 hypothetical protein [Flavobacterium yafengii]
MLTKKNKALLENGTILLLFSFVIIEVIAELFSFKVILFAYRPVVTILLMGLYWITSKERNVLFFITMFFLLVTSFFILSDSKRAIIIGLIAFLAHRLLLIFFIIKLNKLKDFVPILIGFIPFIFIFSYMLTLSDEIPENSYYSLVIQNALVSVLGGIVLSNYFMNQNEYTPWLWIFGVLSVALYFTVFIEKCFLSNLPPTYFRPLAMILYVTSYYSFYRFVIDTEMIHAKKESIIVIQ